MLRTVVVKGDTVEAWIRSRSTEAKSMTGNDGKPLQDAKGEVLTYRDFMPTTGSSMTKLIARCSQRTLAEAANTEYGPDGAVIKSNSIQPKNHLFEEPIPDSVGEKWLERMCQLV